MAETKNKLPLDGYILKNSVVEAAMEQINLRLEAGETEEGLYAACWNEYAYLNDMQENPAHQEDLVAMIITLNDILAHNHMAVMGWDYNEKGRFVR